MQSKLPRPLMLSFLSFLFPYTSLDSMNRKRENGGSYSFQDMRKERKRKRRKWINEKTSVLDKLMQKIFVDVGCGFAKNNRDVQWRGGFKIIRCRDKNTSFFYILFKGKFGGLLQIKQMCPNKISHKNICYKSNNVPFKLAHMHSININLLPCTTLILFENFR